MNNNKDAIRLIFSTDICEEMKDWLERNGSTSSILLNLLQYDIHGEGREKSVRDTMEWICKSFGEPTDNYYAVGKWRGKNEVWFICLPDSMYIRNTKYGNMNYDERKEATNEMKSKSFLIFTLLKTVGFKIDIFKQRNTDLEMICQRKTIRDLIGNDYWRDKAANKKLFYIKEGSYYYLYAISPRYLKYATEVLNYYKMPYKEIQ